MAEPVGKMGGRVAGACVTCSPHRTAGCPDRSGSRASSAQKKCASAARDRQRLQKNGAWVQSKQRGATITAQTRQEGG